VTSRAPRRPPGRRAPAPKEARYTFAGLVIALLLLGGTGLVWLAGRAENRVGGPFTLEDGQGRVVTERDFRGEYMLVYFGYTHCPDVCPTTLSRIAAALALLGPQANRVVPVFITIDPARDTAAVMRRYAAQFTPRLVGLTGTAAEIASVAREYHVYYAKRPAGPGSADYSMDHSTAVYLMGPTGRLVAPVSVDAPAAKLAGMLNRLMS
jgi:cytochrome oxidase Cu insertion factor (SCO1/SenC/PrrC family)